MSQNSFYPVDERVSSILGFAPAAGQSPRPGDVIRFNCLPRVPAMTVLLLALGMGWLAPLLVIAQAPDTPLEKAVTPESVAAEKTEPPARGRSSRTKLGDVTVMGNDFFIHENESAKDVVVMGGTAFIDGTVTGDLVVLLGKAKLGPKAEVRHNVVVVGGTLEADPAAKIGRDRVVVGGDATSPHHFKWMAWPSQWFTKGLMLARPLPHQYLWSWAIAGIALLLYIIIAVLFPRQVQASVTALETKPGSSFLAGLLAFALIGPLLIFLAVTVVGLVLVPFVVCGLVAAFLFGKVAVYRYAGQQMGTQLGLEILQKPLLALFAGVVLFCLLYTVPVLGFLAWGAVAPLGLGAVLLALFKRTAPKENLPGTLPANVPFSTAAAPPIESTTQPALLPRAGFWLRLLATLLDFALISLVMMALFHRPRWLLLVWTIYHLALWTWQGTTVGGIIFGLKIVRTDGQPMNFAVALVRFLGSFLSAAVLWLGFFWAGWSRDKQSWHDKIAGTCVVKTLRPQAPR